MVGYKLKKLREWKNLTQEYVAEQLDISPRTYGKIESGEADISISKLEKILETLEMQLDDFFRIDTERIFQNNKQINKASGNHLLVHNHSGNESDNTLITKLLSTLDSFCETNKLLVEEIKRLREEKV